MMKNEAKKDVVERWHEYVKADDPALLNLLLADDAVFESPVVHTPQRGKSITFKYLRGAAIVLGSDAFAYTGEWRGERSAILEFESEINSIKINGIDMIWWNEADQIIRFKVMVRPLKAVNMLHQMMGLQLAAG